MGKLHPLIVHLPIGILILNAVFVFLSKRKRYEFLSAVVPLTLLIGACSAVMACVTGWFLSQNGDYMEHPDTFGTEGVLGYHKWLGIGVATASVVLYFLKKYQTNTYVWLAILGGITATGHFGGTLTHGEDYLFSTEKPKYTDGTSRDNREGVGEGHKLPEDIQEAAVYNDLIVPILKGKCYSCHNNAKQKGKLRMDDKAAFLKGGEHGAIVVAGQSANSEMIKRLLLDIEDKHHMAPKGRTQPTSQDIVLLRWWIDSGLDFDKKVKETPQNDTIRSLFAHFSASQIKKENPYIPTQPVEKADQNLIDSVRKQGILLIHVAPASNYLQANFVSVPKAGDREVALLLPFAKQLIWLKLGNTQISDSALIVVSKLSNLTRLSLENTRITDKGLVALSSLSHLQYLNLVGTQITSDGLTPLSNLGKLEQVFIFKTTISPNALTVLKQKMPQTVFDTGGYIVPSWVSDTAVFKRAK